MNRIPSLFRWESQDRELVVSTSRKVMLTTTATYLLWHIVGTLAWPRLFSPSLWVCTIVMAFTVAATFNLLEKHFFLGQTVWFTGLTATIFIAYLLYRQPEIALLLVILPMMAEVMLGLRVSLVVEALIILVAVRWQALPFLPPLPNGYDVAIVLLSLSTTVLGWGLSDNLISAIEASSYHYREALRRLEEARQHRAEISVLLQEVKKANYQLDRLNKVLNIARGKADEAREERDRFALAVSHELRSPLNFIIGFSDLMVNAPETYGDLSTWPPGLYEDVQEIYRSSTHLMGLINDILDMGKIDAQQMTLFRERVSLSSIIAEVCEMVQRPVSQKGLWLKIDLAPDLPLISVDRTRIRQVLLNLVTNSLRFTDQGGIHLTARMKDAHTLLVEVEDTGSGIAPADLPKIFNEFRQVGNQNWRREEGTGLGLAVGRRFIQLHGGEMGVRSEYGHGSTFYFTLPVRLPEDDVDVIDSEAIKQMARFPMQNLGDDKAPLLLFLSADLFWAKIFAESLQHFKVALFSEPGQLREVVEQSLPAAVVIDQALWNLETVQDFVQAPPYEIPILAFAIPVNLNLVNSLPEGVVRYLLKPVSRQALIQTVIDLGLPARTLLVVDDDPGMVRFVTQALKSADGQVGDPTVLTALDGAQALEHLRSSAVDAVFLDLDLPDINGLKLIEAMQQEERLRQVPVVILSANDLPQSLRNQQRGAFQLCVNRPLTRPELEKILISTLETVRSNYNVRETTPPPAAPGAAEPPAGPSA